MPTLTYRAAGQTLSADYAVASTAWTPTALGFIQRPAGHGYVRIEDLGVTLDGPGLRLAFAHPSAHDMVITLPEGLFALTDYVQGVGKFVAGIMVNPSIGSVHPRGIVGSGAGTILQMVPNSSQFKTEAAAETGGTSTGAAQVLCSTINFYQINNVEFGNLTVQGQPQPHYHHGIRINGDDAQVHHVAFRGASQGGQNSPPGETYSLLIGGKSAVVDDCEFDGRRMLPGDVGPVSASPLFIASPNGAIVSRCYTHDMTSGFGIVLWASTGLTTYDYWVARPGTGKGGWNGAHTNHEGASGHIVHNRPNVILDGFWSNPVVNGVTRYPGKPAARNQGKFPHMVFFQGTPGTTVNPTATADTHIIDPVFDGWGGVGGFAVMQTANITSYPEVIVGGVKLTPVYRPQWWVDTPGFDPKRNYWVMTEVGSSSPWG